ncbi:hypothetical protein, partial [Stenotrophomonas maltophilia]|uniref:hypothetical protein n=1 Tax=Stenotrophomonas maltophilia TaxID=40324 RepID=UPI003BF8439A
RTILKESCVGQRTSVLFQDESDQGRSVVATCSDRTVRIAATWADWGSPDQGFSARRHPSKE